MEITKRTPLFKVNPTPQLVFSKTDDPGPGYVEGYLAVFGNVDCDGDVIKRGAFAKTIREAIPAGNVPLMVKHAAHGGDAKDAVGLITEAREDDFGLWIHADFSPDDEAQIIRQRVSVKIVKHLSVGFFGVRWETVQRDDKTFGYDFHEVALLEGTLTCFPANELAGITNAKTSGPEANAPQNTAKVSAGGFSPTPAFVADLHAEEAEVRANLLYLERMKNHGPARTA